MPTPMRCSTPALCPASVMAFTWCGVSPATSKSTSSGPVVSTPSSAASFSNSAPLHLSHPIELRTRGERGESQGLFHHPGKAVYPLAQAFGWKSLCAKQSAALRCSQLPAYGGTYATDQVVEWCAISAGMFGMSRIRAADRQVRSDSGGVGGGPRVDGDQRGDGCGAEGCSDGKVRGGERQT